MARTPASHRRRHPIRQDAGAHHGLLRRSPGARTHRRTRPRHRTRHGRARAAGRGPGPAGPRRIQPDILPAPEAALSKGHHRPGRCVRPARDSRRRPEGARGRHRIEPAAVHEIHGHAPRSARIRAGAHARGRPVHPVHLCGRAADPGPVGATIRPGPPTASGSTCPRRGSGCTGVRNERPSRSFLERCGNGCARPPDRRPRPALRRGGPRPRGTDRRWGDLLQDRLSARLCGRFRLRARN